MSCLFQSLSNFFRDIDENTLRNQICDYLEKNPKIFNDMDTNQITIFESDMSLPEYVSKMRHPSTWGGALEIIAFCEIFNIDVVVHFQNREIEFLPKNKSLITLHLNYNGNHYTPLSVIQKS